MDPGAKISKKLVDRWVWASNYGRWMGSRAKIGKKIGRWVYYKISHIFTEIENRHTTFKNTFFFIYKRYIFQKYIVVSTFY